MAHVNYFDPSEFQLYHDLNLGIQKYIEMYTSAKLRKGKLGLNGQNTFFAD